MDEIPEDLVGLEEAAKAVHCGYSTVYRWVLSRKLRSWQRGGTRYLVRLADVREMLKPVAVRKDVSAWGEEKRAAQARQKRTQEVLARYGLA